MASVEGLANVQGLINSARQSTRAFKETADADRMLEQKKAAATEASKLFQAGDVKGAIGILIKTDPSFADRVLASPSSVSPEVAGEMEAKKAEGNWPTREKEINLQGEWDLKKAKAASRGRGTYQVRNPLTQEVEIRDRDTGNLVTVVGSPNPQNPSDTVDPDGNEMDPKKLFESLNPKQRSYYTDLQTKFMKDSQDDRAAVIASAKVQEQLAAGKELDGDIQRVYQTQFARQAGEKGMMSEPDVREYTGLQSIGAMARRMASIKLTGKIPEQDREFLIGVSKVMQRAAERAVLNRANPYASQIATQTRLNESEARNLLVQGLAGNTKAKTADPREEALKWISANPSDPRVPAIKQKLGIK